MISMAPASARPRAAIVGALLLLCACADKNLPVSLHGVNYSGQIFSYVLVDPANKNNSGGGETIDPYGAGGTMCCYTLPAKWTPGMKVQINATHWLPRKADDSLPEIKETQVVDVPRYVDGKPAELWVLRGADGKISLISSDYQPDHEKWPGKIKGWPVPSLEYRRERWDIYLDHEKGGVKLWEKLLEEMQSAPLKHAQELWDYERKSNPKAFSEYSGPEDERFQDFLRNKYAKLLDESKRKVEKLNKERP